jgi:hypothetical protein
MNMESTRFVNFNSPDLAEQLKEAIGLNQTVEAAKYGTDELDTTPVNNGRVFLKVPGIPVGAEAESVISQQLSEISSVHGLGMNVVGLDDAVIRREYVVIQAIELDFHSESTIREVMQHGVFLLDSWDQLMRTFHTLLLLRKSR